MSVERKFELRARRSSFEDVDVERKSLADDIRCKNLGDKEFCEVHLENGIPLAGQYDEVHLSGDGFTTINPRAEHFDTFIDSGLWYCGEVHVEEDGPIGPYEKDKLVCLPSDVLEWEE